MKRTFIKITLIIMLIATIIINVPTYSMANGESTLDDVIDSGNSFLEVGGDNNENIVDESKLQEISKFISGVLLTIAIGVTLLSAVVMGINFTMQSIEDKAKVKESMVPWVIGIFVTFGAYTIWEITMHFFMKL